ncbi:hypothetical protein GCM10014715_13000 [Streptomyces spiralis]|uniref:Uncharacterized protein n=1 Tax=Streptomyces spiralis TaxID=66376 RepID=A0A919DNQ7_9ACTN|nr:hypothetical protein GCM10014715_13000 [Streptomyces spiralis]
MTALSPVERSVTGRAAGIPRWAEPISTPGSTLGWAPRFRCKGHPPSRDSHRPGAAPCGDRRFGAQAGAGGARRSGHRAGAAPEEPVSRSCEQQFAQWPEGDASVTGRQAVPSEQYELGRTGPVSGIITLR